MPKRVEKIIFLCKMCKKEISGTVAKPRIYCSDECKNTHFKERFAGENNPAWHKTYKTKEKNPEWAAAIKKGCIENEINAGNNNAMKRKDIAEKMSKTRRERVTSDPDYRKNLSDKTKERWALGKYEGIAVGKCKWYDFIKSTGEVCKLQGTWELKYAEYLDKNGIDFVSHRGAILYENVDGTKSRYYPDFFLTKENVYIDIKNKYHEQFSREKFRLLGEQRKDLTIILLLEEDLRMLGIKI